MAYTFKIKIYNSNTNLLLEWSADNNINPASAFLWQGWYPEIKEILLCSICVRYKDSAQISAFPSYDGIMHFNLETEEPSWDNLRKPYDSSLLSGRCSKHSQNIPLGCFRGVYLWCYASLKTREGFLLHGCRRSLQYTYNPFWMLTGNRNVKIN